MVGDIEDRRESASTEHSDLGHHGFGPIATHIVDHDFRARRSKGEDHGAPDTLAGARHEDPSSFEIELRYLSRLPASTGRVMPVM